MSQDEIRKLVGGYATGTLTESERKALFDAALDDQDLFDELAREQSLKELLDSPGARTRLTAVLAPPEPRWSANRLRLAIGGMLAAGFAIALGIVLVVRKPHNDDFAAVAKTESQASESRAVLTEPPKVVSNTPPASPPQGVNQAREKQSTNNSIAPIPPPVLLQPPQEDALKKTESARRDEPAKSDAAGPAQGERGTATKALTDEKDASPPPRPQPMAETVTVQAPTAQVQQAPSGVARQQSKQSLNATPQVVTTNSAGALTAPRVAALAGKISPTRFAFDYNVRRDSLTVNPLAAGFLQVTASITGGQRVILQEPSRQEAGTSVTMPVPAGALSLTIEFSARPAARDLAAFDKLQNSRFREKTSSRAAAAPASPPVISKDKTGHVEEQAPTADSRLSITVAVPAE